MDTIKKILPVAIIGISVIMLFIMYLTNYQGNTGEATDIGIYTTYILVVIALVGIVLGFVLTAITNPASILRTLIGIGVIVVVWFISYGIAGNEVTDIYKKFDITPSLSQTIGGILILTYSLGILAIIGIILTEVLGAFK